MPLHFSKSFAPPALPSSRSGVGEAGNDPVAEAGCGLTVAPESPQAVADGVRSLAACSVGERRAMGERGRAFVLAHHTYPVLAQRFIDAVEAAR